ncbi:hypothetical protein C8R44DRAFT_641980, partial [Mycena epipterygia]
SRMQKEASASRGGVPGRSGARVYVWEKSHGYFIQTAGGHKRYEDIWEEYGPHQRRYDSFHNEWDVCEVFGPAASDVDEDDGNDDLGFYAAPFSHEDDNDSAPSQLLPEKTQQSLEAGQLPPAVPPGLLLSSSDDTVARKFLGNQELGVERPEQLQSFCIFLVYCKKMRELSDIPFPVLNFHNPESEIFLEWIVGVRREILNDRQYYVVFEKERTNGLYVLLESATTALEIVRQGWGPSLKDVIERLLGRNIQFLVCCRDNQLPTHRRLARRMHSGLGFRAHNYFPNTHDYQLYVSIREQFMLSPRGRAAKQYGGIIGRLACRVVSDEEVLQGPTDDVTIDGICLWDGYSQLAYWGNCLTEQEIDLICGVYHISTGKRCGYFAVCRS